MKKLSNNQMLDISGSMKCIYIVMGSVLLSPFSMFWSNSTVECFMNTHKE